MAEVDIKVSFSKVTMEKTAFGEMKENVMYLLSEYQKIMGDVVWKSVKQGQVHDNLAEYIEKTSTLKEAAETIFQNVEDQLEQWKVDFEEADEELYEE